MELKEQYEKLRKKHGLPDFEELDKNFEISLVEEKQFTLSTVRKKINEKIWAFVDLLENLLHPNSDLCCLYETNFLDEKEKDNVFELYKKLMHLSRTALKLSLENNEEQDAEFIKESLKEWNLIKGKLLAITEKLKKAWLEREDTHFRAEYLG